MTPRFEAYCRRKEAAAASASIPGYTTAELAPNGPALVEYGTAWSRAKFDGGFYRSATPRAPDLPIISLVFVQSRDGNTVVPDPSTLGGGATDLHLIYEGLSRVDADAVMAGSATARGREIVFSVWHPDLVELRLSRGHARHPAQVVVTDRGNLRLDDGLMFQEPDIRVFVVTRSSMVDSVRWRVEARPWIEPIDAGEPLSLRRALRELRQRGVAVVSCVGGPRTATSLLQDRLVSDVYLTTSAIDGGEPNTPYYDGPPLAVNRVTLKDGQAEEAGVRFEHLVVD